MAESSERELTPDAAGHVAAARAKAFVLYEGAPDLPEITPIAGVE